MTSAEAPRWRLHVGAHKTATTHLQDTLALNRDRFAALGLLCPTRDQIRAAGLPPKAWMATGRLGRLLTPPGRALADAFPGQGTMVLSEELLLGLAPDLLAPVPYPAAEARLAFVARLSRHEPVALFLSIRNFAEVLPSGYAQAQRAHVFPPGGFEVIRRRALAAPPRWSDLAQRLRRVVPGAPLTIWTFEAWVADPRRVLSALLGIETAGFTPAPVSAEVRSPSGRAVAEAERQLGAVTGPGRPEAVARLYETFPVAEFGRFDPLSAEEKATLGDAYRADLAALAQLDGVRVIDVPRSNA